MKTILMIFIFNLVAHCSIGQNYSLTIDSLTKIYISKLSKKEQIKFDSILNQRLKINFLKRLDTTSFEFAFIEEYYCYSSCFGHATERYFFEKDSIPKSVYIDGEFSDPKEIYGGNLTRYKTNVTYYFYTLQSLIDNYSKLKATQKLNYEKQQTWSHGCVTYKNDRRNFKRRRKEQLKSTYQIQTMIDKRNNKILVSIQYAPLRPKFKIYNYNGVWDW